MFINHAMRSAYDLSSLQEDKKEIKKEEGRREGKIVNMIRKCRSISKT